MLSAVTAKKSALPGRLMVDCLRAISFRMLKYSLNCVQVASLGGVFQSLDLGVIRFLGLREGRLVFFVRQGRIEVEIFHVFRAYRSQVRVERLEERSKVGSELIKMRLSCLKDHCPLPRTPYLAYLSVEKRDLFNFAYAFFI